MTTSLSTITQTLLRALLASAALTAVAAPPALAAPAGAFDPSFGGGPFSLRLVEDGDDQLEDIEVLPDGRVLVLTEFELLRLRADGTLDPTFSGDGRLPAPLGPTWQQASALAVDEQGRALVGGELPGDSTGWNAGIARVLPGGTLDPAFGGGDGIVEAEFAFQGFDSVASITTAEDGDVVVGGNHAPPRVGGSDFGVLRLTDTGDPETGFSTDGRHVQAARDYDLVSSVAVDAQDRVVLAGASTDAGAYTRRPTVVRLTAAGTLDAGLDGDGIAVLPLPGAPERADQYLAAAALDGDGRLVLVGGVDGSPPFVARMTDGGTLDAGFGTGGVRWLPALGDRGWLGGLAVQPDGAIVAAGNRRLPESGLDGTVTRLLGDGTPDTAFGSGGTRIVELAGGGVDESLRAVGLQEDGRITVAGSAGLEDDRDGGSYDDVALARLLGRATATADDDLDDGGPGAGGGGVEQQRPAGGGGGGTGQPVATPGDARPRQISVAPPLALARVTLARPGRAPRSFGGTTTGASRVEVSVVRRTGRRCAALVSTRTMRFARTTCAKPRRLRAAGTARWRLALAKRLPRGSYVVVVLAVGADGRAGAPVRRTLRVR